MPECWAVQLGNGRAPRQLWKTKKEGSQQGLLRGKGTTKKCVKYLCCFVASLTTDSNNQERESEWGSLPSCWPGALRQRIRSLQLLRREGSSFTVCQHHVQWKTGNSPKEIGVLLGNGEQMSSIHSYNMAFLVISVQKNELH